MKDYEALQPLIHWSGDVTSLINEMKRRAGVRTDAELAAVVGRTQGAVSHWRKSGQVPEAVLLTFDDVAKRRGHDRTSLALVARAIAVRLAEFMYQQDRDRGAKSSRWLSHVLVATGFHSLTDAIYATLPDRIGDRSPFDSLETVLEDEEYLTVLARFVRQLPIGVAVSREAASPPGVIEVPQSVPQSGKSK